MIQLVLPLDTALALVIYSIQGYVPHAKVVNKLITSSSCLTTATHVVWVGKIDDKVIMKEITVE